MNKLLHYLISSIISWAIFAGIWVWVFFPNSNNPLMILWGAASVLPGMWWSLKGRYAGK